MNWLRIGLLVLSLPLASLFRFGTLHEHGCTVALVPSDSLARGARYYRCGGLFSFDTFTPSLADLGQDGTVATIGLPRRDGALVMDGFTGMALGLASGDTATSLVGWNSPVLWLATGYSILSYGLAPAIWHRQGTWLLTVNTIFVHGSRSIFMAPTTRMALMAWCILAWWLYGIGTVFEHGSRCVAPFLFLAAHSQ